MARINERDIKNLRKAINQDKAIHPDPTDKIILDIIKGTGAMVPQDIMPMVNFSPFLVSRRLAKLVKMRLLECVNGYYKLKS